MDEILLNISKNDPHAFLQKELLLRKEKKLPPFYRLISLIISGKNELLIMKFATVADADSFNGLIHFATRGFVETIFLNFLIISIYLMFFKNNENISDR